MGFSKTDVRIAFIAVKLLENALPYPDEVDEFLDKCNGVFDVDELHEIETEVEELMTDSDELKEFARSVIGKTE